MNFKKNSKMDIQAKILEAETLTRIIWQKYETLKGIVKELIHEFFTTAYNYSPIFFEGFLTSKGIQGQLADLCLMEYNSTLAEHNITVEKVSSRDLARHLYTVPQLLDESDIELHSYERIEDIYALETNEEGSSASWGS